MRPHVGALLSVFLLAGTVGCAPEAGGGGQSEGDSSGVTKELGDLGREIKRAMAEQGEYVGDRLGELGQESGSWLEDRGVQARVKTTLLGVLGLSSLGRINVDVDKGEVALAGELTSWGRVARTVRATNQVVGVMRVVSRLRVPVRD